MHNNKSNTIAEKLISKKKTHSDHCGDVGEGSVDPGIANEEPNTLKNAELPDIPDSELLHTVTDWLAAKFSGEWSGQCCQCGTGSSVPEPCRVVHICWMVVGEIKEGGFTQLFCSPARQFAEASIEGFSLLGSPELAAIMERAIYLYRDNKTAFDAYWDGARKGSIKRPLKRYSEKLFSNADESFYEEIFSLNFVKYIRLNAYCFGD